MRKPPKKSIDYYLLPNKILCSMIGMWPSDEERSICSSLFSGFRIVFSLMAISTIFVPGLMLIAVNWGDIRILTGAGCISTTLAQFIFKTIYLVTTREKSYRMYKELRSLWDSSHDPEARKCYENLAYWARTCTILFFLSAVLTVIVFTISASIDYVNDNQINNGTGNSRHLPFDVWYGKDVLGSPSFEIAFVCQILVAYICVVGVCSLDTMCMTTILHLSGQFHLISKWVSNIGVEINCQPINYLTACPPNLAASLIKCIRHHQRLINAVNDVNNLLTPIIFVQLLTSGIEICLSGFAVISNDKVRDLLKFISYLTSMMIQLLMWCWPGEILIQNSLELGDSIYLNIPWYKLPPVYRRQLLLMILRSQNYCRISALTFQTLSIHTLTTVFNTAASYFALLRQMQEKATLKNNIIM